MYYFPSFSYEFCVVVYMISPIVPWEETESFKVVGWHSLPQMNTLGEGYGINFVPSELIIEAQTPKYLRM